MSARVLVTGGAGFIGSHLVRRLVAAGYDVVALDDLSSGKRENLPEDVELIEADAGRRSVLDTLGDRRFDSICHLAGQSSGEKSFDDPVHDLDANARSTSILARYALETGAQSFIHASSMSVYGDPPSLPVAEDAPKTPLSYYGSSKLAAEQVLAVAAGEGLRVVCMRMFSVYGPGQDLKELRQGVASIFLAYLLQGVEIPVTGPLDRVRDLVHVDDVVAAWQLAIERDVSGPFNLGTGVGTTLRGLIEKELAALGMPADHPVSEQPRSPGDQHTVYADIGRAQELLGWTPAVAVDDGLQTLADWARSSSPS